MKKPMVWDYAGGEGPLIVGQAPSRSSDGQPPFHGRSGERLASVLSMPWPEFASTFRLANLIGSWPGYHKGNGHGKPDGKRRHGGDHFDPRSSTATCAAALLLSYERGGVMILCGRAVALAFAIPRTAPMLSWRVMHGCMVGIIPHPSGVNHWWNARGRATLVRAFLQQGLTLSRKHDKGKERAHA